MTSYQIRARSGRVVLSYDDLKRAEEEFTTRRATIPALSLVKVTVVEEVVRPGGGRGEGAQ